MVFLIRHKVPFIGGHFPLPEYRRIFVFPDKPETVQVYGKEYPLKDTVFPTLDENDPYALSTDEKEAVERLRGAFLNCEKLQRHVRFLFTKGSLYNVYNGNLLYHGCIPMKADGSFESMNCEGKSRRRNSKSGVITGKTVKTKKAVVTLTADSKDIEIFAGL